MLKAHNTILGKYAGSVLTCIVFAYVLILSSCAHKAPKNVNNLCEIFQDKNKWYKYAKKSTNKWGTPMHVQMAILHQESKFQRDAKPNRKKLLGFIPWKRASSAYGYAQALNQTWKEYIKATGNRGADRDKFKDAIDFVGWYTYHTHKQAKVSKWDAYNQYLAYHEGRGGFMKKSYNNKKWLLQVARKVDSNAKKYSAQLKKCNL
ncbi:MAG: transglycosylase SLT domain-containing protein [Proteobacteria bacterium]|nr:transglycosylase SLT domain-containing protein [Pseudomonadota bacterium]